MSRIFWFWIPLAAMWLMMAIEQPTVAAVVARLPKPELNLAIFGVTFSLAVIIEGPIIMLLTAGTALARGKSSYERLLRFTHILAAALTALHLLIALTSLYPFIMGRLIGVPPRILEASRLTFLLMTPWAAAVAYRRLWEGVLIGFHRTRVVPLTFIARLSTGGIILAIGLLTRRFRGADLGAMALTVGLTAAAMTAYGLGRSTVRQHLSTSLPGDEPLPWSDLLEFYIPLALTSLIMLAGRPVLVMGLARAAQPLASLAVWPVIMGVVFLVRSFAISYQEVVVALMVDESNFANLRRFTVGLAVFLTGAFVLINLTPGARLFYRSVSGLSPELATFTVAPTLILSVLPGLAALISWKQGLLVHFKQTRAITLAVALNVVILAIVLFGGAALLRGTPGAIIAAVAHTAAVAAQWGYLSWSSRQGKLPALDRLLLKRESFWGS